MKNGTARPLTNEVRQFMHFNREGDIIPHGWNKHIGRWHTAKSRMTGEANRIWRSRPYAERLLARIIWFYTPTPLKNDSGDVVGWQRKFKATYWQINFSEMGEALGCSSRTIKDELALLVELGLVTTAPIRARRASDGTKSIPIHVIPIHEAIVKITGIEASEEAPEPVKVLHWNNGSASEEPSLAAGEEPSTEPVKNLHSSSIPITSVSFSSYVSTANAVQSSEPAIAAKPLEQSPIAKDDVPPRERDEIFDKLVELTHANPKLQGAQIGQTKKKLLSVDATPQQLTRFAEYWRCADWRGVKGQSPTLPQIVSEWGKAMAWQPGMATANGYSKQHAEPESRLGKGMDF